MAIVATGQMTIVDLNDSKSLALYIGSSQPKNVVFNPNNNVYVPNYSSTSQVLTPQLFIAGSSSDVSVDAKSTRWYYQTNSSGALTEITANGGGYTLASSGVKTLTISSNVLSSNSSMTYICEMIYTDEDTGFDITTKAEIELVKLTNGSNGSDGSNGANAIMAVLSNDAQVIPTDSSGNNGNFTGAETTISVFVGASDNTSSWSASATPSSGVTGTLSGKTYTVTNMTVDTGYVDITVSRSGYASITKRFALSKSKQGTSGSNGSSPTTYWLIASVPAIGKDKSGNYVPSNIVISSKSQTGTSSPVSYSGRFKIEETTDNSNYTTKYTSSANQSSYTHTPSANIKALRISLYLANGTTNLLDQQIIPIVSDGTDGSNGTNGSDGQDAVLATVWTPDGNTLKNGSGTLSATCEVFKGATNVSASSYKWYIQDPTATTASGGDSDGGNGWRKLTSTYNAGVTGYTSSTITIPASAIASVESFKCVATYSGNKFQDICTVIDVTDPILVTIVGLSTFKNGQGSSDFTAKLYQNGSEVDSTGSGYTYSWSIYKSNGTLDSTFSKTGKTISVNASDISGRGNLICEVSK
ncbi:hypothetical protein Q7A53_06220 [Halobacillus rhizosphaerae]|uniref:hypothetical protein n=1 Tax=Halobacillus rhizosphaerae TaxID=3064889 RepID=UPI00398B8F52